MAVGRFVGGNVRPRHEEDDQDKDDVPGGYADSQVSDDRLWKNEDVDGAISDEHANSQNGAESDVVSDGEDVTQQINNVSFSALLQAQDALSKKRKRGSDTTAQQDAKLQALRQRLQEIKDKKQKIRPAQQSNEEPPNAKSTRKSHSQPTRREDRLDKSGVGEEDESDSAPSEEEAPMKSRSSKHAPGAQSSRHQVTRKRTVIDVPKRASRDPRFDALQQNPTQPGNIEKAYSFLIDYQKDEIAELKTAIKQTRSEEEKELLKRKVVSMENRLKSKESKDRQQEVLRRHRKEEREKVEQGKKPFFLKKKDVKEQALVEKFQGMKKKDQTKLIEKRRRREGQKEKKRMPQARRVVG